MNKKEAELYDAGYRNGVRDAVEYLADLFEGIYDTQVFEMLEVEK